MYVLSLPSMPGLRYVRNVVFFYHRMHPASYVVLRDYIVFYVLTLRSVQSLSSRIYSHLIFFWQGISYKLWDILNWIQCLWYRGSYKCKQTAYAYKGVLDVLMHVPPYYYLYHFRYFCFCVFLLFWYRISVGSFTCFVGWATIRLFFWDRWVNLD